MKKWNPLALSLVLILGMLLAGCGGGGSSTPDINNPGNASKTVTGVAATGTPISGTVYLKDSSNPAKEISTLITAGGSYSFDVSGLTAPYILKAVGTADGQNYTLYSLAGTPGIANINPLSHMAVVRANKGVDPTTIYNNLTPIQLQAINTALATAIAQIQALLQPLLSQYGVATKNFVSDDYTANHTGLDLLFDMVSFVVNNATLTATNKINSAGILTSRLDGATLSGSVNSINLPAILSQVLGTVYIYPASALVAPNGSITFKAIVIGAANQAITWSVVESNSGNINSAGVYTAPAATGTYHIKATNVANTAKSTIVPVTVAGADLTGTASFGPFTTDMFANRVVWGDGVKIFTADHKVLFVIDSPVSSIGTWSVSSDNVLTIISDTVSTAYKFNAYVGAGVMSTKNLATISNITAGTSMDWALQSISYVSSPALYTDFAQKLAGRTLTVSLANGTPATLTFIYFGGTGNLTMSGTTVPFTYNVDTSVISVVTSTGTIKITAEYEPSAITGGKSAFPVAWTTPGNVTYYGTGILQ